MKFTRFTKITASTAAGFTVLAVLLMTGTMPASAQEGRNGQNRQACGHSAGRDFCETSELHVFCLLLVIPQKGHKTGNRLTDFLC